jgi:hypothetical protein
LSHGGSELRSIARIVGNAMPWNMIQYSNGTMTNAHAIETAGVNSIGHSHAQKV